LPADETAPDAKSPSTREPDEQLTSPAAQPGSGGRNVADKAADPQGIVIPERRAVIGAQQQLNDEDYTFLRAAFDKDLVCKLVQRNPKKRGSASRARYEKYKAARSLRDIKQMGGSWQDIVFDYARGFIDFHPSADLYDHKDLEPESLPTTSAAFGHALSAAAEVDSSLRATGFGLFSTLSFEESVRQEFAMVGLKQIESLSPRIQQLLHSALEGQTLAQFAHCCAANIMIPEPLTHKEAMASKYAKEWKAAEDEEIANLERMGCFDMVARAEALRHGRLVKSKWVYKVKYNADGTLQRFKARLVAKGFTQVPGVDYSETYSPVFSYSSLRTVLSLAARYDLRLDQWDLESSFIQQKIDVDHLYMECPDGYPKTMPDGSPAALHVRQSIYGLKQASKLLHEHLSGHLKAKGFRQLVSDQCVFVKGSIKTGDLQIACIWVDDIILATMRKDQAARENFDKELREEFKVSPWTSGEAGWILNMNIKRDWSKGTIHLSQPGAIKKLAEHFNLTGNEGRAPSVPMNPHLKLVKPAAEDIVPAEVWDYQSAVGGLLYISLTARPEVAQSVGVLSRFMSCPGKEHVEAAKQVIRYLYATKEFGITYSREKSGPPHMFVHAKKNKTATEDTFGDSRIVVAYADADLAGDEGTRKSTSGYAFVLHGGLICWLSKLQSTVALSTAEAETIAGVVAVKQVMHLRLFLGELGFEQLLPSVVYEDNNAAISLAHGREQSKRSKHYQMKVHFLNDQYQRGEFAYEKVGTSDQLADAFTKALPRESFTKFREWMGVGPPPAEEIVA